MFCIHCGQEQRAGAKFCHNCGLPPQQALSQNVTLKSNSSGSSLVATNNSRNFYPVSVGKFLLLSIITFGLYPIFWFAKNWRLVKDQEKSNIYPIARAIFGVFFFSNLASKVLKSAKERGYDRSYSPGLLAVGYFMLSLLFKLQNNYWLLGFLSLFPFIPVLEAILYNNEKSQNPQRDFDRYKTGEIVALVIGGILWLLVLIGLSSPT